jgi:PAS domain S-box-containing protein
VQTTLTTNESARLAVLKRYEILDTPNEAEFDDLTRLAADICDAPIALVSLVDADRQWFKSRYGLDVTETPRAVSFCAHAIHKQGILEVSNALDDTRFRTNPLVTREPKIRFYAGSPLVTPDGHNVGTLCVIDRVPRQLTPVQHDALARLSRQVVRQMELRLNNRRLAEQVAFQRTILASAASAIISTTPEGLITQFNPAAERMLGYTGKELIGIKTPAAFHSPVEVAIRARELSAELGRKINAGFEVFVARVRESHPETREWSYIRKDGSSFPVILSVSAMHDDDGKLIGFLGIARDISARKEAERQIKLLNESLEQRVQERTSELAETVQLLRTSEERFRAIFEQATVGVALVDKSTGQFLEVNDRCCAILGRTREQTLATNFQAITHKAELRASVRLYKQLQAGRVKEFTLEQRCVRPDRSQVWVRLHASRLTGTGGHPDQLLAVMEDINERKNAEANYHREREFNEILVNHTSAIIMLLDREGRIVHVNDATVKLLGHPPRKLIGHTPLAAGIVSCGASAASSDRLERLFSGEASPPRETVLVAKDGSKHIVELSATSTSSSDGSIDRIIITGNDLSERNRLQKEILKISEQEQARIGHNLHDGVGQTMTGIGSLIDSLEAELSGEQRASASRIRELVREATQEVRRMSHGLSPTAVKNRSLAGALELQAEIVQSNFRTACNCEIETGIQVSDPEREMHLFRIAQEATNNALRHGHPKRIQIFLRRVKGAECELRIEDDGSGFRKSGGKKSDGIGMQVMDYRANLINGSLEVSPGPHKGVVVTCRFMP